MNSNHIGVKVIGDARMATESLHGLSKSFTTLGRDGKRANSTITGLTKSLFSLKGIVGAVSLYKLVNMFSGFTKSAMDMTESIHLFNVAMGDMAEDTEKVVTAMSAVSGLDNTKLLDTIGSYNLLARSMGVTAKNAQVLSVNTSKLAIDLSALTNRSIQKVSEDLRSGLIGQAKTMYKYGIDVTEASIKQEALNRGITKSVRHMSQAEKMTLRYAVMIRQASLSHGDFSKTIETPANQLRILSERILTLGRTIGTMFIPIISKVLPWINALVVGLTRLARILATLFGYKGESPIKNMENDFMGGADGADDLADSVGGAGKQVDKLKKKMQALAGFDELNILGTKQPDPVDSGAGGGADLGGAFEIDLEGYDNLFDEIKQKSEELVDDIIAKFMTIYEPLAESIGKLKGAFSRLGAVTFRNLENIWNNFFKPLAEWAMSTVLKDIIDGLTWMADVLYDVGVMLEGIDYTPMVEGIKALWEAIKPFAKKIGQGLEYLLKNVLVPLARWAVETLAPKVFETLTRVFESLTRILEVLTPLFKWFVDDVLIPLGQWTGDLIIKGLERLGEEFEKLADFAEKHPDIFEVIIIAIGSLITAIGLVVGAFVGLKGLAAVAGVVGAILASPFLVPILVIAGLIAVVVLFIRSWDEMKETAIAIGNKISESYKKLQTIVENVNDKIDEKWQALKKSLSTIGENIKKKIVDDWNEWNDKVQKKTDAINKYLDDKWDALKKSLSTIVGNIKKKIVDDWEEMKKNLSEKMDNIKKSINDKWEEIKRVTSEKVTGMITSTVTFFSELPNKIKEKLDLFKTTISTWVRDSISWFGENIPSLLNDIVNWFSKLPSALVDVGEDMIKGLWNGILGAGTWLMDKMRGYFGKLWDVAGELFGKVGSGVRATFSIPQRFARGGTPEMGSLFIAGESGAELIGSHRGSSTVMPLEDSGFVEAMSKAVYSAVVSANGGKDNGGIIIQIGERTILDTLASGVNRDTRINGKSVIRV